MSNYAIVTEKHGDLLDVYAINFPLKGNKTQIFCFGDDINKRKAQTVVGLKELYSIYDSLSGIDLNNLLSNINDNDINPQPEPVTMNNKNYSACAKCNNPYMYGEGPEICCGCRLWSNA